MTKLEFDKRVKELDCKKKELAEIISRCYRIGEKVWVHIFAQYDYSTYILLYNSPHNKKYLIGDYRIDDLKGEEIVRYGNVKRIFEDWCNGALDKLPESNIEVISFNIIL